MTVHERPFGRYFEDFEIGDVYKHWPGKTITEYDDHLFCMITMNHHPLHTDAWYAERQTQFGKNVVVGNLVYSLVLGMSVADVSGAAIANLRSRRCSTSRRRSTATRSTPRRRSSTRRSRRASPTAVW
jgi:acyl dehydratase